MKMSVITPSYKQLDWLRLCVASICDQVSPQDPSGTDALSVEHIIQDAGTDGVREFAEEEARRLGLTAQPASAGEAFVAGNGRYILRLFVEKDNGMYDAVNRGFRRASGDIFSYLNCDEEYLPGALKKVSAYFQENAGIEVAFGDTLVVHADGSYMCHRKGLSPQTAHTWVSENLSFATASSFARALVFHRKEIYFDTQWKDVGDADWGLRLCRAGVAVGTLGFLTSTFTDTGDNMNMRPNAILEKTRLRGSAPRWMQTLRNPIIVHYRLRKALAGAYKLEPGSYRIYTKESPAQRVEFRFDAPTHRWSGR